MIYLKKYIYLIGIFIIIVALIIYKLPFLSLPYYWDEAWPYSVAIHTLYDHGLSFLPTSIPAEVSRGHPLMFHFLAALWMKIFGTGLISGHLFALFVSICLLIVIFLFCSAFFSKRVGFIASLLFATQAVFIAQSAFLLPEVLLALWTMLGLYTFYKGNKILFVLFASAMLLTKESGGILICALALTECVLFVSSKDKQMAAILKKLGLIFLPVAFAGIYFVMQKVLYGWFLFPFYMNYIASSWTQFRNIIPTECAYFFIYYGRNGISFFIIFSIISIVISGKIKMIAKEKNILFILSTYIILFLIFSSVNYYIPRYLLCAFPPFIIIGAVLLDKVFSRMKIVYPLIILGLAITNVFYYATKQTEGDLNYSCSINTNWECIRFMEQEQLQDKYVFAPCVLRYDLCIPCVGFLSGKPFSKVSADFSNNTEYCVFSREEYDAPVFDEIKKNNKLQLLKRYQKDWAWCELYKVVR